MPGTTYGFTPSGTLVIAAVEPAHRRRWHEVPTWCVPATCARAKASARNRNRYGLASAALGNLPGERAFDARHRRAVGQADGLLALQ